MTGVHSGHTADAVQLIRACRILPVVVIDDANDAEPLAAALTAGGLHIAEVTFRTDAAAYAISVMSARADLLVGAGTVLTPAQVDRAVAAGARFVLSPGFSPAVVRHCQERGVPVFPGVCTATDIQMALDAGLETVKFFPAEQMGGVATVNALASAFGSARFIPTGGVHLGNLAGYLAHPAVLAVGGSWIVAPDLLASGRWSEVASRAAAAVAAAQAGCWTSTCSRS